MHGRLQTNRSSHTRRSALPPTYSRSSLAFAPGGRTLGGCCCRCPRQQQQCRCRRRWSGCFWSSRQALPLLFLSAGKRRHTCRKAPSSSIVVSEIYEKGNKNYLFPSSRPVGWFAQQMRNHNVQRPGGGWMSLVSPPVTGGSWTCARPPWNARRWPCGAGPSCPFAPRRRRTLAWPLGTLLPPIRQETMHGSCVEALTNSPMFGNIHFTSYLVPRIGDVHGHCS